MTIAIQTAGLSKQYRIGELNKYPMLREALTGIARAPWRVAQTRLRRADRPKRPTLWALKDIDITIDAGEIVGIVGRNGAGKSTLLKVLSGITEPTEGHADVYGRVGSLLEVGTGFHMELTGRENIFLNGALLGMGRHEIRAKFDEIVAFSEVDEYLDTPVKRYSSGMYMRLAFAVAAHLEPEILIVDEVLAVGDATFQKKCLGKMGDVARDGRTVLFVSHNMALVQSLCERVIWLDSGRFRSEGRTNEVVNAYLEDAVHTESIAIGDRVDREGDGSVRVHSLRIEDADGRSVIHTGSRLRVTLEYASSRPVRSLQAYVAISDANQVNIYGIDTEATGGAPEQLPAEGTLTCITDPINITTGRCYATVGLYKSTEKADLIRQAMHFDIEPDESSGIGIAPDRDWVMCTLGQEWSYPDGSAARSQ
jgi:lipopolysaccharide transport system ATP-binding protein